MYKANSIKIERRLKNTILNSLPVYDDRYIKTDIKAYSEKVYFKFSNLIVLENKVEYKSLTIISVHSLLAYYKNYYIQIYLENSADKIVNTGMQGYLDNNLFGTNEY